MTVLPILKVRTAHSLYLIDQNEGTVIRTRVHDDASDLAPFVPEGTPKPYQTAAIVNKAGEPVPFGTGGHLIVAYEDGSLSVSTEVQSVEELQTEEAA